MDELIRLLKKAAVSGQREIESGDSFRHQLTDEEFSRIVPPHMEGKVIEAMVASGEWYRGATGFDLIAWRD